MYHPITPYLERFKDLIDKGAIIFYTDEYESNNATEDLVNGRINIDDINSIKIDWYHCIWEHGITRHDIKRPRAHILKFGFKHLGYGSYKRNEY